jgi:hypothetical protein
LRHKHRLIGRAQVALGLIFSIAIGVDPAMAQVRGVYPLGMTATNSGVTPASGFSYANQFLTYSRSELKDAEGATQATGKNSVVMDMNSIVWVSPKEILAGAKISLSATLPVAKNSLTSDVTGPISGGSGFADSYYQPFIMAWETKSAAIRAAYGFLAPTGSFDATASDNVGSGYWTHVVSSGQTFFLTADKATAVSVFQMYEFHTTQEDTNVHPGQNLDLDYSVTRTIPAGNDVRVQVGLVGYGAWQTTDKSTQAGDHYKVNAVGFATNVVLPSQKMSVGFKYFQEFSNRSTFQGHSIQISGSIKF